MPESGKRSGLSTACTLVGTTSSWWAPGIATLCWRDASSQTSKYARESTVRISAGIALVDAHQPLYRAAYDAIETLEGGSKAHRRKDGPSKDAITFLGETVGWEEFDPIQKQVVDLVRLVGRGGDGGKVPRSLLSMLGALSQLYRKEATRQAGGREMDPERLYYGRWTWMAAYGLGRARERTRDEAAKSALAALQKRLSEPAEIRRLGLVARWAEYLTRSREANKR